MTRYLCSFLLAISDTAELSPRRSIVFESVNPDAPSHAEQSRRVQIGGVPQRVSAGAQSFLILAGDNPSQPGIAVAVRQ